MALTTKCVLTELSDRTMQKFLRHDCNKKIEDASMSHTKATTSWKGFLQVLENAESDTSDTIYKNEILALTTSVREELEFDVFKKFASVCNPKEKPEIEYILIYARKRMIGNDVAVDYIMSQYSYKRMKNESGPANGFAVTGAGAASLVCALILSGPGAWLTGAFGVLAAGYGAKMLNDRQHENYDNEKSLIEATVHCHMIHSGLVEYHDHCLLVEIEDNSLGRPPLIEYKDQENILGSQNSAFDTKVGPHQMIDGRAHNEEVSSNSAEIATAMHINTVDDCLDIPQGDKVKDSGYPLVDGELVNSTIQHF